MLALVAFTVLKSYLSVDLGPAPLSRLAPDLGKQLGINMACSGPLRNRVGLIKVENVSREEIMAQLAKAVGGEWEQTKTGIVLSRSPALDRKLRDIAVARRAEAIRKKVDEMAAEVEKAPSFDLNVARKYLDDLAAYDKKRGDPMSPDYQFDFEQTVFNRGPSGRATIRVLKMIDPKEIASVRKGNLVYATSPNKYERPLPEAAAGVIEKLWRESDAWKEALEGFTPGNHGWIGGDPRREPQPQGSPGRILLVVSVQNPFASITAELWVADARGETVVHSNVVVNPGFFSMGTARDDYKKNSDFGWSDPANDFVAQLSLDYHKPHPAMSKGLEEKFLNPQKWDPLSFGAAEPFVEEARREHLNLIAAMPDDLMGPQAVNPHEKVNLAKYLRYLEAVRGITITREGGWMVVAPKEELGPANWNIDRDAVGKFCRELHSTGMVSLDASAAILLAMPDPDWDAVVFGYTTALTPRLERMVQFIDPALLRVYGSLSESQRRAIRAGGAVPVSNLSEPAKAALESLLLDNARSPSGGIFRDGNKMALADPPIDLLPTELLAKGLPPDAALKGTSKLTAAAVLGTVGGRRYTSWTQVVDSADLAGVLGSSIAGEPDDRKSSIWFGKRLTMTIEVPLADGFYYHGQLEEVQVDVRKKPISIADLPEATRKAIDAATANAAKREGRDRSDPPPPQGARE